MSPNSNIWNVCGFAFEEQVLSYHGAKFRRVIKYRFHVFQVTLLVFQKKELKNLIIAR